MSMRVLFAGTPEVAVPSLEALLSSRHEVVAVLTRPDARAGRGRQLTSSPVAQVAERAGVEALKPAGAGDPGFLERLRELAPDCVPVVAYGGLVPPTALQVPGQGWVNLHFSLLPAWRGAAPVQRAVLAGDDVTGASTFRLEEGLDTGPVYGTVTETVHAADTSGDLLRRLAHSGSKLLVRTLDGIEDGDLVPLPQPDEGVSLAPKLGTDDARVDWNAPALHVDRLIRACTPAPGAWTTFRDQRLKIHPVTLERGGEALPPGQIDVEKSGIRVGTGSHPVVLGEVQPQGKRPMSATDWARGVRPRTGERIGS